MGFISKIYSGVSNAISTEQGKLISGFAYGIGASIVIIGALFKILHLPGAEEMLMVGMGTEAFLFALGAFEPPHKEYDWSMVYPELAYGGHGHGAIPEEVEPKQVQSPAGSGNVSFGSGLSEEDIEKLKSSLQNLSKTASQLNDISGASIATENYIKNIEKASGSVDHFADVQSKGAERIGSAAEQFETSYQKVITSFETTLTDAHKSSTDTIKLASEKLMKAYTQSADQLSQSADSLGSDSKNIAATLNSVNSNLTKINSVYELQLQSINQQLEEEKARVKTGEKLNTNLESISQNYEMTVAASETYKKETEKLSKQIADLNAIYGNMLNALNIES